ncbi:MAG: hypothetical protein R3C68_01530 [Myxococcota bacterium]
MISGYYKLIKNPVPAPSSETAGAKIDTTSSSPAEPGVYDNNAQIVRVRSSISPEKSSPVPPAPGKTRLDPAVLLDKSSTFLRKLNEAAGSNEYDWDDWKSKVDGQVACLEGLLKRSNLSPRVRSDAWVNLAGFLGRQADAQWSLALGRQALEALENAEGADSDNPRTWVAKAVAYGGIYTLPFFKKLVLRTVVDMSQVEDRLFVAMRHLRDYPDNLAAQAVLWNMAERVVDYDANDVIQKMGEEAHARYVGLVSQDPSAEDYVNFLNRSIKSVTEKVAADAL